MNRTELASIWPPTAAIAREAGHKQTTPLEAIRLKCLDCCCYQPSEVRLCEAVTCPSWPFRAGKHPYTKGRLLEADFGATCAGGPVRKNPPPGGLFCPARASAGPHSSRPSLSAAREV
jgi:hypothetical protein